MIIDYDDPNKIIGDKYEAFIGCKLESDGWNVCYIGHKLGVRDHDIDLIATQGKKIIFIQCKYHNQPLGEDIIHSFRSGYDTCIDAIQRYLKRFGTKLSDIYKTPKRYLFCKNEQYSSSFLKCAKEARIEIVSTGSIPSNFDFDQEDDRFKPDYEGSESDAAALHFISKAVWKMTPVENKFDILFDSMSSILYSLDSIKLKLRKITESEKDN